MRMATDLIPNTEVMNGRKTNWQQAIGNGRLQEAD